MNLSGGLLKPENKRRPLTIFSPRKPFTKRISPSVQNCMLGLIHDQVWMGSKDSIIYIIDSVSMSCNQQLTEHRQEVTSLAADPQPQSGRSGLFGASHFTFWVCWCKNETPPSPRPAPSSQQAYSCSSDGTILQWDSASLKVRRQFSLRCERLSSIQVHDGALWCCEYLSVDCFSLMWSPQVH